MKNTHQNQELNKQIKNPLEKNTYNEDDFFK